MTGVAVCAMNKRAAGAVSAALGIAQMSIVKVVMTLIALTMPRTIATTVMILLAEASTLRFLI